MPTPYDLEPSIPRYRARFFALEENQTGSWILKDFIKSHQHTFLSHFNLQLVYKSWFYTEWQICEIPKFPWHFFNKVQILWLWEGPKIGDYLAMSKQSGRFFFNCLRPTQNIRTLSYAPLSVHKNLVQYAYYSFCLLETFKEFLSKNTISSHISFSMWPRATFYDILLQNIQVETRSVNIGKDSKFAIFEKKEKSKMLMNVMRFMHFK